MTCIMAMLLRHNAYYYIRAGNYKTKLWIVDEKNEGAAECVYQLTVIETLLTAYIKSIFLANAVCVCACN